MSVQKKSHCMGRKFKISDLNSIKQITHSLHPKWFTEEALENIPRDIHFSRCFVAEENEQITGFISVCSHDGKPMIGWLGVKPELRGEGIGRLLLEKVEKELKKWGYKDLRVETVGKCTPEYKPYAETLSFYRSAEFKIEKRGRLRHDMGHKWRYSTLRKKLLST